MLDLIFASLRGLAEGWRAEAAQMRRFSAVNPVADTREFDAKELLDRVRELEQGTQALTPDGYAKLKGVTPQTVRGWCRRGELPGAERAGHSWRIPRTAERRRRAS